MTNLLAKQLDAGRPQYLVVFREASEQNTSTLSGVLKRGKAPGARARAGVNLLAAADSGVVTRVFEHLGVGAADLTDSQVAALRKRDDVAAVVENQVRFLPPVRRSLEAEDGPAPDEKTPAFVAYLQGLRDAANLALAYHQGGEVAAPAPLAVPAAMGLSAGRSTWGVRAVGARDAALTGRGVKVAALDTGLDLNHPDLGAKVVEGVTAVSMVTGVSVQDVYGHGTHCAGTICGPVRSRSGLRYGVAPDVELLLGKVFNNRSRPGATDDDILEGIAWADENGAQIISMSLGSNRAVGEAFSPLYENLARQLLDRAQNSVLIVAAAGNESERPTFSGRPRRLPVDRGGRCRRPARPHRVVLLCRDGQDRHVRRLGTGRPGCSRPPPAAPSRRWTGPAWPPLTSPAWPRSTWSRTRP